MNHYPDFRRSMVEATRARIKKAAIGATGPISLAKAMQQIIKFKQAQKKNEK